MEVPKRITKKLRCPNPLFEFWLTEWRDKAKECDSNRQYTFGKALASLKKYPLPLETGRDCKILSGFGDTLCNMLDTKLKEHKQNTNFDLEQTIVFQVGNIQENDVKKKPKSPRKAVRKTSPSTSKEYIPTIRSGPYAILVTLYKKSLEPDYIGHMLKADIIKEGKFYTDTPFVSPHPGERYTAWSSMKTLLGKQLVAKAGNPAKFSLTEEGAVLGHKLYDVELKSDLAGSHSNIDGLVDVNDTEDICNVGVKENAITNNYSNIQAESISLQMPSRSSSSSRAVKKIVSSSSISSNSSEQPGSSVGDNLETLIFPPSTFDIILLVDTQETIGNTKYSRDDPIKQELSFLKVPYEIRHLKVGDYTWVCRDRISKKELVLPYIIERKRVDDFGSSIKDGRFHEQKFRLKQSGIKNLIYLVEYFGNNTHTGLPITTLHQAATNTLIHDGFSVKFTKDLRGTAEYLCCLTQILIKKFEAATVVSCSKTDLADAITDDDLVSLMHFEEFNKGASKNKTFRVQDMFVKQLLQLKGMSVDRALAIAEKYPTPRLLKLSYEENTGKAGEKLLSAIEYGKLRKKIGPVLSKTIFQHYTLNRF